MQTYKSVIYDKLYIFEKPLTYQIKICKNFCKIFMAYMCIKERLNLCKFPFKAFVQKATQNFFAEIEQSDSACCKLSKEL